MNEPTNTPTPQPNTPEPSAAQTPAPNLTPNEPVATNSAGQGTVAAPDSILQKRIIAGVIDSLVAFVLSFVISFVFSLIKLDALAMLGSLVALAYILLKDSLPFLGGQSIGKKMMNLRAVTSDGNPLTNNYQAGAIRNVFLMIGVVELVILFIRESDPAKRGLRLGDDFAKTKVLSVPAA